MYHLRETESLPDDFKLFDFLITNHRDVFCPEVLYDLLEDQLHMDNTYANKVFSSLDSVFHFEVVEHDKKLIHIHDITNYDDKNSYYWCTLQSNGLMHSLKPDGAKKYLCLDFGDNHNNTFVGEEIRLVTSYLNFQNLCGHGSLITPSCAIKQDFSESKAIHSSAKKRKLLLFYKHHQKK
jgi:hypothetical protein